jgi:hypothetical protein
MIVRFLKWALSKFEPAPTAWPFPTVSEDFEPRPCEKKTKPRVKKATTRPVKTSPAAKRTTAKKAK